MLLERQASIMASKKIIRRNISKGGTTRKYKKTTPAKLNKAKRRRRK